MSTTSLILNDTWKHSICLACATDSLPELLSEFNSDVTTGHALEWCCYCGWLHRSGLYLEANGASMPCFGKHREVPQEQELEEYQPTVKLAPVIRGIAAMVLVALVTIIILAVF